MTFSSPPADAIVVGAGPNGLAAAIELAVEGAEGQARLVGQGAAGTAEQQGEQHAQPAAEVDEPQPSLHGKAGQPVVGGARF